MEERLPHSKTTGKPDGSANPVAKETKMTRDPVTPAENDPLWEALGATQNTDSQSDISLGGAPVEESPSNYTEMSASRVLGRDVVVLGGFKLLKKLGEGAMGAVYKAEEVATQRIFALKILFPHVASNPKLLKRLEREGLVMGRLDHPNIVQAYAVDEAGGFHYIAMEYVPGQSTQKWLTQLGRFPVADALRIALDCAAALTYAHSLNIVHRDIKPDNILLTKTGLVKVADLGMAKSDDDEMSLTQTGQAIGTPWYMPLEQARNAKEIDGRSDIYALGCTLYAFLTGHPPFSGHTIVEVIQAKETGKFSPARQVNSDVPERLDLILDKMTAKLLKQRYQTCAEVLKDLESLGLASATLSFLHQKPVAKQAVADAYGALGKTSVSAAAAKSGADADLAKSAPPSLDLNLWYVQVKMSDGSMATRKYTTVQLQQMLEYGTIKPTIRASHSPDQGFRTLGTYKEFQGAALSNLAKKGADKNSARYRNVYKKIEEAEREKAAREHEGEVAQEETTLQATRRYWVGLILKAWPISVGIVLFICLICWLVIASRG